MEVIFRQYVQFNTVSKSKYNDKVDQVSEQRDLLIQSSKKLPKYDIVKNINLHSVDTFSEQVTKYYVYEKLHQTYACKVEEVDNILNCIIEVSTVLRDRMTTLMNDRYNIRSLKQKQIDCTSIAISIELLLEQLSMTRPSLDVIDRNNHQIQDSEIPFTEYFLTEITPQEIHSKYERTNTALTSLYQEVQETIRQYEENISAALVFVQEWNLLYHWVDKSLVMLDSTKIKIMDDIKMIQYIIEQHKTWSTEYNSKMLAHYHQLCDTADAYNVSKARNDDKEHFIKDTLEMYGIVSVEQMKKRYDVFFSI
jgi:hypothetical protein